MVLQAEKNAMLAFGALAQAALGTGTVVDGLAGTQTAVPSLTINIGPGSIFALSTVDATAYGSISADAADPLVKIGQNITATPFTLTAPTTSGQSINYLIEATLLESDNAAVVLPYYNAANPASPFLGPLGAGTAQPTARTQRVSLQLKAGVAATTGTQTTPAVDSGWVGLYVVTVNYGQTAITTAQIVKAAGAPFIGPKLPQLATVPPQIARSTHGVAIGASYSGTVSVSFVAPCAGYVVAQAGLNISLGTAAAPIIGTLYINGTGVCNDSTLNGQTQQAVQAVAAGSTVTVAWTITTTTSPATNATYFVGSQFVPCPN